MSGSGINFNTWFKTMSTKAYISKILSKKLNISSNEGHNIVTNFINLIKEKSEIKKIKLKGFGTFNYYRTPKRKGRNPKTLESYIIAPRKKLVFAASNKIKKILN